MQECYFCDQPPGSNCEYCKVSFCTSCFISHDQVKCREIHSRIRSHSVLVFDPLRTDDGEDFFVPVREGLPPVVTVEYTYQEDLEYFRQKLWSAIKIPPEYLRANPVPLATEDMRMVEAFKKARHL